MLIILRLSVIVVFAMQLALFAAVGLPGRPIAVALDGADVADASTAAAIVAVDALRLCDL